MKQRVITAILMAIVFIPFFFLGGWFITFLFSILSYIAMYELITMYQSKKNIPNVCKYILVLLCCLVVLQQQKISSMFF